MYTQCQIQYSENKIGTAWIPTEFAKRNKNIIIGKKDTGEPAKVLDIYATFDYNTAKDRKEWHVGGL